MTMPKKSVRAAVFLYVGITHRSKIMHIGRRIILAAHEYRIQNSENFLMR